MTVRDGVCGWMMLGVLLSACVSSAQQPLRPRVIETRFPTADIVIASLSLAPPADESTDAAPLLQAAIDQAAAAGGAVVYLAPGRYRLASQVVLKEGVTLRGDWLPPDQPGAEQGTILMPTAGRGQADGPPAVVMERGTGLREMMVWYPDQRPDAIAPYPWAIRGSDKLSGDNYTLQNLTLVNAYQGAAFGPEFHELHTLRNVYGTPLKTGLFYDSCTDIGRTTAIDFSPRWWEGLDLPGAPRDAAARAALREHLRREALGIDMRRSDWEFMRDVRIDGYATGIEFNQGARGAMNGVLFAPAFTNVGVGLRLNQLNGNGLCVTGGRIEASEAGLLAPETFGTLAQLNSVRFAGPAPHAVRMLGGGTVTLQNCTFEAGAAAAVAADAGTLTALGCRFEAPGADVVLGGAVERARVLANTFDGEPRIDAAPEAMDGDLAIAHAPMAFALPNIDPPVDPPAVGPRSRALWVATDHGLTPDGDNTAALQALLDVAGQAGGGTVYLPAGTWPVAGSLTVPSGVELRGIFDVPHHTISGGSSILATGGRGQEDAPPLISLQPGAGLRGINVWYPEQNVIEPVPYPWTVRGLGPGCWLVDVNIGNAWQGVDFWTHPSTGHVVRYLSGGFLRRGLFVSKSDGEGWVEDLQFNPHYTNRVHRSLPRPEYPRDYIGLTSEYQRAHLEGIVFGRCAREHITGTFLYAGYDGLAFRDDDGATNARIVTHGSDTVCRSVFIEAAGDEGLEFVHAQLVPLGADQVAGVVTAPGFGGRASFFNSVFWAGATTALIEGGEVLLQQFNTYTGPVVANGGRIELVNGRFGRLFPVDVRLGEGVASARVVANFAPGTLNLEAAPGVALTALANSASSRGPGAAAVELPHQLATSFEPGEPQGLADQAATRGGGLREVGPWSARAVEGDAHSGRFAYRLEGVSQNADYSFVYAVVLDQPLGVAVDSLLTYWRKPLNEKGQSTFVDIRFADGTVLRDSGAKTLSGSAARGPGGAVGEWTKIEIPLGQFAGKSIDTLMLAYDSRSGGEPFAALIDDLRLESVEASIPGGVTLAPAPGVVPAGTRVTLTGEGGSGRIRYTLDGRNPDLESPVSTAPITLDRPGLWELRYTVEGTGPGGEPLLSRRVRSALYEVR